MSELSDAFNGSHELVGDSRLQLGKELVLALDLLKLFLRGYVFDAQDFALLILKNDALKTDLDLQELCLVAWLFGD